MMTVGFALLLLVYICFLGTKPSSIKMPRAIEKSVRKQNILFMHKAAQFCPEYFQFMKKLLTCNRSYTENQQEKLVGG